MQCVFVCVINENGLDYLCASVGWLIGPSAGNCALTSQLQISLGEVNGLILTSKHQ